MPHLHKKLKNGKPYYYLREIQRIDGKPRVVKQTYLGTPERLSKLVEGGVDIRLQVEEFGAVWMADQILSEVGLVELINSVTPRAKKIAGISVGEYFYYAVLNRIVEPCSKSALADWLHSTAIQSIRPTRLKALSSQNYWKAWEAISPKALEQISDKLFQKLSLLEPTQGECFIFDTTNYFTFIAPENKSSTLAQYGKSKSGRDDLRQISLALVVSRDSGLPLFYREFPGNLHDSKVFSSCMHRLTSLLVDAGRANAVFIFDKGITAPENIAFIDSQPQLSFITAYVPTYLPELLTVPLPQFAPTEDGRYLTYRTTHKLWNKERTLIVQYNPRNAQKQKLMFDENLGHISRFLESAAAKVAKYDPHWRDKSAILKRISDTFASYKIPMQLFAFWFEGKGASLRLQYNIVDKELAEFTSRFGKQILVTDLDTWSADKVIQAYNDRYQIETAFRQSKDRHVVSTQPFFHWTDSKVRCHLLCCFLALCASKLIELKLNQAKLSLSAQAAIESMKSLHVVTSSRSARNPILKRIEKPNPTQHQILRAFHAKWVNGVLQTKAS